MTVRIPPPPVDWSRLYDATGRCLVCGAAKGARHRRPCPGVLSDLPVEYDAQRVDADGAGCVHLGRSTPRQAILAMAGDGPMSPGETFELYVTFGPIPGYQAAWKRAQAANRRRKRRSA